VSDPVIDVDAEEIGTEVVRASSLAVMPAVEARELVGRLAVISDAMHNAMQRDVDYGVIPGTNKPALLKPGAEKLSVLFQLDVQLVNEKVWGPGDHLTVMSQATVHHAPTGLRLGFGEGLCTTKEKKYAVRKQERVCPTCEAPAVIKGKAEYGGGWLCWKKRDGCGAKFRDGDEAIESQEVGTIENPDLPDLWNTVVKMAEKRARVDAVLAVTGASALFTQDVEEQHAPPEPAPRPARSDIPADDPAWEKLRTQIAAVATGPELKSFLVDTLGVALPANVSSWKRVIGGLSAENHARLTAWLQARTDAKAEVPWESADAAVDALKAGLGAEEVKAA
jgi:hypothetical protein